MALPLVQNVGTLLRHLNADLQRIIPDPTKQTELETLPPALETGRSVIEALRALKAGDDPVAEGGEVGPNTEFKELSDHILFRAIGRLSTVTQAEADANEQGQFNKIHELKTRVERLQKQIAKAASR